MMSDTRRWAVMGLVFLGILISYVDRGNASIVAVPLMKEFALSPTQMGLLMSSFFWTYAVFQVPAGYLIDRFGIRAAYTVALVAWSIACASTAWATSFTQLILLRLLLGMGEAVSPIASLNFIKQNFEENRQGLPTSIYIAGLAAGPAVGAFLGGRLLDEFGWRQVFLLTGVAGLLWALPWWLLAPRGRPNAASASEPVAALPLKQLLRSPVILALWAAVFFYSYFWYFVLSWVSPYLVLTHGFTSREMGDAVARALFCMAAVNLASGTTADWVIKKTGGSPLRWRKAFVLVGFSCASSLLALPWMSNRTTVIWLMTGAMTTLGIAAGNFWALSQMSAPKELGGRVMGLQNTIAQLAGITAPSLTGFLLGPEKNFTVAILIAGAGPLIAAASVLFGIHERGVNQLHATLALGAKPAGAQGAAAS